MLCRKGGKKGEKKEILNKFLHKTNETCIIFFMHQKVVCTILYTQPVTAPVLLLLTFTVLIYSELLKNKQCSLLFFQIPLV